MEISTSSYIAAGQLSAPNLYSLANPAEGEAPSTAVKKVAPPGNADQGDPLKDPQSEESIQLEELKARDREVRTHEQAHLSAAGQYAKGGASYTYQRGPDGQQYAVGGEVQIDTSEIEGDPQATLEKAQTVQRAALAPAEPSGQDRAVASQAAMMASKARQDIAAARNSDSAEAGSEALQKAADNEQAAAKLEQQIEATGANWLDTQTTDKQALSVMA